MSTPTPRTDAATYPADCLGATLVTNRDCSRELERELDALTAERDQLRADLEQADAFYQRACEVEHELRAEVKRMTHAYEYDHKCLYEVRDRCHLWKQRAEKAEVDLAAAKERLRSEAMDDYASIKDLQRELAIERARLNWLETPSGMDWQWEPERLTVSRASIDAAMKEDAK